MHNQLASLTLLLCALPVAAQSQGPVTAVVSSGPVVANLQPRAEFNPPNDAARSLAYFGGASQNFVQIRTTTPALCMNFAGASGTSARIIDPNNTTTVLNGIVPYSTGGDSGGFRLVRNAGGMEFRVDATGSARCYGFTGQSALRGTGSELIFTDGFEGTFFPGVELVTTITVPTSVVAGQTFNYAVLVRNLGDTTVSGVQIKDWVPLIIGATAPTDPAIVDPPGGGPFVNCSPSFNSNCGTFASTGALAATGVTVEAGGSVQFTLERVAQAFGLPAGANFRVHAAAVAPLVTSEPNFGNNASSSQTITVTAPPSGQ